MTTAQNLANLSQMFSTQPLMFRNKLINGNFDIWQRGTSASTNGYLADRWNLQAGGTGVALTTGRGVFPISESAVSVTPSKYYWYTTITNGGDATNGVVVVTQKIEGVDSLRGKITVSFGAAVSATQKIAVNVFQNFGTGGSPSAAVFTTPQQVTPTGAFANNRYYLTFDLPSTAGKIVGSNGDDNIEIAFYFSAGTSFAPRTGSLGIQTGTFYLAAIQVESGSVATHMEQRPDALELALCQRYYQYHASLLSGGGMGDGGAGYFSTFMFPTAMRATPTATYTGVTYSNASGLATNAATPTSLRTGITTTVDGIAYAIANVALNAEL